MAITAAQAVNYLVAALKASPLVLGESAVTGKVYPFQRPLDSAKEDVVVNSLPMGKGPVQQGVLNVNVYVPNLTYYGATTTDTTRPDMERLTALSVIGGGVLEDYWYEGGQTNFELLQDTVMQDENNQHYINFRVIFRNLNIN